MTSNEHPDMSGNPCDEPILCEHCGEACNENKLHGSDHDESKTFCRQQCVDDWEEVWGSVPSDDDGSTSIDKKLRDLQTIRDYLRNRRDELQEQGWHSNANQIGHEVSRLNILIAEAEAKS